MGSKIPNDALANLHHTFGILNDQPGDEDEEAKFYLGQDMRRIFVTNLALKTKNYESCKCPVNLLKL